MSVENYHPFSGDKKVGRSMLSALESKFRDAVVPRIPLWIETHHLTLATIPLSALVVIFGYLAQGDVRWLWGTIAAILLQYVTDLLDGAVGRYRNTGLIKWGYYMDHFLDYTFLCALLIGNSLFLPHWRFLQFFILAIFGGFMVSSYLEFAATNKFKISHLFIGPTEIRLAFIIAYLLFIFFGKTYLGGFIPYVFLASTVGLWIVVILTQKRIWEMDMREKTGDSSTR